MHQATDWEMNCLRSLWEGSVSGIWSGEVRIWTHGCAEFGAAHMHFKSPVEIAPAGVVSTF